MSKKLLGKLAVVTGSASGIGRSVCERFSKEGASLVMIDNNEESLKSTKDLIKGDNRCFAGDVTSATFTKTLFKQVQEDYGRPADILVNSAGIIKDNFLLKMSEEDFDKVIDVNLKGVFLMTQSFVTSLSSVNGIQPASIINISSIIGKSGNVGQANYAASKSAVIGFTKSIGYELGRFGVRCNSVLPGYIETPMTEKVPTNIMQKVLKQIPMKRAGKPEEIANVCLFLASDESSYINCASLEVTGGLLA